MSQASGDTGQGVTLASTTGRWVALACVLGSGVAGIDATVVNIALPDIGRSLDVRFAALQWTVTAYSLTLASLILLGGSLGDRFGRRRIFVIGVIWFAAASALCSLAPDIGWLVAARALQGVGGALLTPASLAIIQSSFAEGDRAKAIGTWSAWSGTAAALAPFVGGWLLAVGSWRWIFVINLPLAALIVVLAVRHVPETRDYTAHGRLDMLGAALGIIALGGITAGTIAAADYPFSSPIVLVPLAVGVVAAVGFVVAERTVANPMLPMSMFASRQFSATNAVTFLLYGAMGGALLLLVVALQTVSGFSPLVAGTALLPITVMMLAFAGRFGALSARYGPRLFIGFGPLVSAVGLVLMTFLSTDSSYWTAVLPAMAVFGLGAAIFVAPLTATVLAAAPASHAGVASGVNNAVARAAGLIAVAALPTIAGLSGDAYESAAGYLPPFRTAIWICVGLQVAAGVLALCTVRNDRIQPGEGQIGCRVGLTGDQVAPAPDGTATHRVPRG